MVGDGDHFVDFGRPCPSPLEGLRVNRAMSLKRFHRDFTNEAGIRAGRVPSK